jgi:hypothetical protein
MGEGGPLGPAHRSTKGGSLGPAHSRGGAKGVPTQTLTCTRAHGPNTHMDTQAQRGSCK